MNFFRLAALPVAIAGAFLLCLGGTAGADAWVNCDTEGSGALQEHLQSIPWETGENGAGVLHVSGTCHGNFRVPKGRNFTLRGPAILDGDHRGTVLEVGELHGGVLPRMAVENIAFFHGAPSSHNAGGGLHVTGAALTVRNCSFLENRATAGGGVSLGLGGSLTIDNSTIANNESTSSGGGVISAASKTVIRDSRILLNKGGGVSVGNNDLELRNTQLTSNEITHQGAAGAEGNQVTIVNSTVRSNTATGEGHSAIYAHLNTKVENSAIIGNHAGPESFAGGIAGPGVELKNTTVAGNAGGQAGGVAAFRSMQATSSTFSHNKAHNAEGVGGIYAPRHFMLHATILSNDSGGWPECHGDSLISRGYNLIHIAQGCGLAVPQAGDMIGSYASPVVARLGIMKSTHAGSEVPPFMPLMSNSPAIDAIPAAACPTTHDQLGQARPIGSGCDIGAVER